MPEFKGKIRLEDGDSLETTLTVDSRRLVVKAGEHEIGNWSISELSAKRRNSQFRIKVEGEELVVDVADPIGVANALDVKADEPKGRRGKKPRARRFKRTERSAPEVKSPAVVAPAPADPVFVPEPPPVVAAAAADPVFVPETPPVVAPAVPDTIFFGEPEPAVAPPVLTPEPPPVVAPAAPDTIFFGEPEPAAPPVFEPEPPPVNAPAAAVAEPVLFAEPEPEPEVVPAAVMPPVPVPEPAPVIAPVAVVTPPVSVPEPASGVAAAEGETVETKPSLWQRTPMRTKLIGLGVIGFIILFFVAPSLLALVLMLAGVATLFLAIAAKNESGSGFMPPPFFATNMAIAGGFGSVLLAMAIMVIT